MGAEKGERGGQHRIQYGNVEVELRSDRSPLGYEKEGAVPRGE